MTDDIHIHIVGNYFLLLRQILKTILTNIKIANSVSMNVNTIHPTRFTA